MKSLSILMLKLFLTFGAAMYQAPAAAAVTLPAGASIQLLVLRPVYADASHVSLQVDFPVLQGERVAVPANTEVLGVVEPTAWRGRNGEPERARLHIDHMILPNHQMVALSGVVDDLPRVPSIRGGLAPHEVVLPVFVGGLILSALTNNVAPLLIGLAGGTAGGIAVARTNRDGPVWLRGGRHYRMILDQPLTLVPQNAQ